jgi:hypothetical protein
VKINSEKEIAGKDSEGKGDAAHLQTASPKKMQSLDVGWERVKYAFYPKLEDLTWTEVKQDYLVGVNNVSYRVTDASIQKEWNQKWNFEVAKERYAFKDNKSIKGKKSFVSVSVALKNMGKSACQCALNCIALHICDENGEKIISSTPATASLDNPNSKSYYFKTLQSKETLKADIVYIVQDKYLKDGYYYFVDVLPWDAYPQSKEETGIFKLPLGIEGDSHDKK